jgi:hypothetical protein
VSRSTGAVQCTKQSQFSEVRASPRPDFLVPNKMKPAKKIRPQKHRGRPATGQGVQIGTRWPEATVAQIDAWASWQEDTPARSESIRRLVDIGLGKAAPALAVTSAAKASSERAREMAGNAIDKLKDNKASPDDQASRKRRLVKGPEEFQNVRRDRPSRK